MRAVFLDTQTFSSNISFAHIKQQVSSLVTHGVTSADQVIERSLGFDIVITNKVVLTESVLSQLPSVKLICIAATGTNNVDMNAAKTFGMEVQNVAGYAKNSVSQYVFSQILNYYSNVADQNRNTEVGLWQNSEVFCLHGAPIEELAGKTLGLIGYGDLSKAIEKVAVAFDMNVLIAERKNSDRIRAGRQPFEQVIAESDIISLHCPLTQDTDNLINLTTMEQMKSTAMLVNTARGAIVNSHDLLVALKRNEIAYAVLDVLEQEPPSRDHPLLACKLPNLKITGHIAWASKQAQQRLILGVANNIKNFNIQLKS